MAKILNVHLLKFARAEKKVLYRDLVPERLTYLRNTERQLRRIVSWTALKSR